MWAQENRGDNDSLSGLAAATVPRLLWTERRLDLFPIIVPQVWMARAAPQYELGREEDLFDAADGDAGLCRDL